MLPVHNVQIDLTISSETISHEFFVDIFLWDTDYMINCIVN